MIVNCVISIIISQYLDYYRYSNQEFEYSNRISSKISSKISSNYKFLTIFDSRIRVFDSNIVKNSRFNNLTSRVEFSQKYRQKTRVVKNSTRQKLDSSRTRLRILSILDSTIRLITFYCITIILYIIL